MKRISATNKRAVSSMQGINKVSINKEAKMMLTQLPKSYD
jgi:hypothetical protein